VQGVPQWPALPDSKSKSLSVKKNAHPGHQLFLKAFFGLFFKKPFSALKA
jgi:hypothetical protein